MRRAEMLLLKSLAETPMADRDNRHDDLQATMRLAHLSSPEMILYMVNRVLELEESIERIAAVLQKLSADEPMPLRGNAARTSLRTVPAVPRHRDRGNLAAGRPLHQHLASAGDQRMDLSLHLLRHRHFGPRPSGQGRFGVVPNSRQISGRSS